MIGEKKGERDITKLYIRSKGGMDKEELFTLLKQMKKIWRI